VFKGDAYTAGYGQPSTSVSILKGLTVTVDGVVVEEFHKPFTSHQDVTVCTEVSPPGELVVVDHPDSTTSVTR
jgi:hypothetical protein